LLPSPFMPPLHHAFAISKIPRLRPYAWSILMRQFRETLFCLTVESFLNA
jgi:hypothetical protein